MKKTKLSILLFAIMLGSTFAQENTGINTNLPLLKGKYLGQEPPGMKSEEFAPYFFATGLKQNKFYFSKDGHELYFTQRGDKFSSTKIYCMKEIDSVWNIPEVLFFSKEYINNEISLSPDNQMLFFTSNRPDTNILNSKMQPDIWYVEKDENGNWGNPINAGSVINTPNVEAQPFLGVNGNFYFTNMTGIFESKFIDEKFQPPVPIEIGLNTDTYKNSGPCLSNGTNYLIFHSNREGGFGNWDLYVSFKTQSGNWSDPINLGSTINTADTESNATMSPDGKYMFFSRNGKIYWVSTETIDKLKPEDLN